MGGIVGEADQPEPDRLIDQRLNRLALDVLGGGDLGHALRSVFGGVFEDGAGRGGEAEIGERLSR